MAQRVNIVLEDRIWEALRKAPKGERSRIVNRALEAWLRTKHRRAVARRMDEVRQRMPRVSTRQIVEWLREDRERGS